MELIIVDRVYDDPGYNLWTQFETFYDSATKSVYRRSTYYVDHWRFFPTTLGDYHAVEQPKVRILDAARIRAMQRGEKWFEVAINLIGDFCIMRSLMENSLIEIIGKYLRTIVGNTIASPHSFIESYLPTCDFSGLTIPKPTKNTRYDHQEDHKHDDCGMIIVEGQPREVERCDHGRYCIYSEDDPLMQAYIDRLIDEKVLFTQ